MKILHTIAPTRMIISQDRDRYYETRITQVQTNPNRTVGRFTGIAREMNAQRMREGELEPITEWLPIEFFNIWGITEWREILRTINEEGYWRYNDWGFYIMSGIDQNERDRAIAENIWFEIELPDRVPTINIETLLTTNTIGTFDANNMFTQDIPFDIVQAETMDEPENF